MINRLEQSILSSLQYLFDEFGWFGVGVAMLVENSTGLMPSEVILGLAGWMLIDAHDLPFSFVFWGGFVAAIGSTMGASVLYWTSLLGGRPVVNRIVKLFRINPRHMQRIETMAEKWGTSFIFFGRLIPGVRTWVAIPAGLARMSFISFAIATFAGAYLWCTLFIGIGYFFGHEWHLISKLMKDALPYILTLGVLTGLYGLVVHLWLRQTRIPARVRPE